MAATPHPERVLIVHSSRFGQSEKIAQAVQEILAQSGIETETAPLTRELTRSLAFDPTGFALIASVRYGHFDKRANRLLERHRAVLDEVPTLLMTVSLTARTPEKRDPEVHVYTKKFLTKTGWKPTMVEVVAGALQYRRYNWFDAAMIRFIMKITGGERDKNADIEYTDWEQVSAAGHQFARLVSGTSD
ncbi:MAG: menaquinone-dependent protoporphyrinogen IX dehydrogenase [Bifidobacteriaceae bacterium]|nr:menaquinone-dependent protoporphyrinogen IX dehydrogenase [Bifidobacteriaceae bacterium]